MKACVCASQRDVNRADISGFSRRNHSDGARLANVTSRIEIDKDEPRTRIIKANASSAIGYSLANQQQSAERTVIVNANDLLDNESEQSQGVSIISVGKKLSLFQKLPFAF